MGTIYQGQVIIEKVLAQLCPLYDLGFSLKIDLILKAGAANHLHLRAMPLFYG